MRARSTPFALFLALLVVLWQPLCLCDAEGGEGGHAHSGATHATEGAGHHHASDSPGSHDRAKGDTHDQGNDPPCDGHGSGCDCSKSFANSQKTGESGKTGLEGLIQAAVAWLPITFVDPPFLPHHGIRDVALSGLPPPPLLKLYRVLLI